MKFIFSITVLMCVVFDCGSKIEGYNNKIDVFSSYTFVETIQLPVKKVILKGSCFTVKSAVK